MAYYVDNDGNINLYQIGPCHTIKLDNGEVLTDPPPGEVFATERSAQKYSDLIKELGNKQAAQEAHSKWVKEGAPRT